MDEAEYRERINHVIKAIIRNPDGDWTTETLAGLAGIVDGNLDTDFMRPQLLQAILWGGLSAGVLDFIGACVTNAARGVTPLRIAQSIASGWLGAAAFRGGYKTAALGVTSHFLIALTAAAVFVFISRQLPILLEHVYVSGALYGVAVFWFIQLVVLPLSAISFKPSLALSVVVTGMLVHILCVGLPIVLRAKRFVSN
jgi:hypothetical protein